MDGGALAWLEGIGAYLSEHSLLAAAKVTEGIYRKAQLLEDNPQLGFRISDVDDREVRVLLYGHYRIIYEIKDDAGVFILAIFHASLDIDRFQF